MLSSVLRLLALVAIGLFVAWVVRGPRLPKRNRAPVQWPQDVTVQRMAAGRPVLDDGRSGMKCFDPKCRKDVVDPVWLQDDACYVWPFCSETCADQPWPMHAFDENEPGEAAQLYAEQELARAREARRTELATIPATDLRLIIEQLDAEKEALTLRNADLEDQHVKMMTELEDALSVRDSLSDQLVSTNARLNVHKKEYPRMFYHRDGKTAVVQDAEAGRALRRTGLWFDHPDKAEASRQRVYNLKKPAETVINETPDGKLAAMTPGERQAAMQRAVGADATHRPKIDRDRIDVTVDVLKRPMLPGKVE